MKTWLSVFCSGLSKELYFLRIPNGQEWPAADEIGYLLNETDYLFNLEITGSPPPLKAALTAQAEAGVIFVE